jgi:hypothetical protein
VSVTEIAAEIIGWVFRVWVSVFVLGAWSLFTYLAWAALKGLWGGWKP